MRLISMIQRCIERARSGACATCDNKHRCVAAKWQQGFAFAGAAPAPAPRPAPSAKPFLDFLGELSKSFERPSRPRAKQFRREVEQQLERLLETGDANLDRVASDLGLSRQTLYRRLKAEGTTFEEVLDGLRRKLALRYVRGEGVSAKEAAYRLGFSDPAAFSRAFKRWTGRSPSEMRAPH